MGVICIAQERQPNHCDELIAYDVVRYHAISPPQQLGFPIIGQVTGIPTLVFLDAVTGEIKNRDGREIVVKDPEGKNFPN